MTTVGGWSDLPLDLFSLIFSKLSLPQFLRSAAVCASWSSAVGDLSARGRCVKFRGQSPWLVLNNDDNPSVVVTFYALDEAREYTIPVPDPPITDRLFLGSAHGWIITMDARLRVQLLNPIIGAQIDLPGVVFPYEHTQSIRDSAGRLIGFKILMNEEEQVRCGYSYINCLEQFRLKAILSADPSLGDGYTVAVIQHSPGRIFFISSGDDKKWLELRNHPNFIENTAFHKGKLYMSTLHSVVYVCDLDEAARRIQHDEMPRFRVVDRSELHYHYFFETPRGDLLSIWRERFENYWETISVKVYRVIDEEEEEKPPKRLRVEKTMDMEEFIIFSDSGYSAVVDKEASMLREEAKDLGDLVIFLGGRDPLGFSPYDFPVDSPRLAMIGGCWSDLPLDLFSLIFSKLFLPQFLRSAVICASWSAAISDLSSRGKCFKFRGQSPWLVLNDDNGNPSVMD
ncbi:F-box/kelch-repeat protein At1g57790-like [Zingiber officinale]|uniref:F-box domain-containing protein n=1 Tax=Zingiber officinale TaxID=94328 RepID=A0A8J5FL48_ZINOF|nr:F-box/kelch-repeat protein At1g57790-like [Zingiber officinale]KAG6486508.1 hypothetical protein ZIOFF_055084 [Zingiber officinale]